MIRKYPSLHKMSSLQLVGKKMQSFPSETQETQVCLCQMSFSTQARLFVAHIVQQCCRIGQYTFLHGYIRLDDKPMVIQSQSVARSQCWTTCPVPIYVLNTFDSSNVLQTCASAISSPLSDVFCNPGKIIYQLLVKTDNFILFCGYLEFTNQNNIPHPFHTDAEKQKLILYASIQLKHNAHL